MQHQELDLGSPGGLVLSPPASLGPTLSYCMMIAGHHHAHFLPPHHATAPCAWPRAAAERDGTAMAASHGGDLGAWGIKAMPEPSAAPSMCDACGPGRRICACVHAHVAHLRPDDGTAGGQGRSGQGPLMLLWLGLLWLGLLCRRCCCGKRSVRGHPCGTTPTDGAARQHHAGLPRAHEVGPAQRRMHTDAALRLGCES